MKKSAKYFLNNNGKKLLAVSVMVLLLSGSAQPVLAASAEILDGTANDKYAQVNSGDIYGSVYGVRNDADASGGTIKMNEGAARGKMPSWCAFCDFTNKIKKGEIQE